MWYAALNFKTMSIRASQVWKKRRGSGIDDIYCLPGAINTPNATYAFTRSCSSISFTPYEIYGHSMSLLCRIALFASKELDHQIFLSPLSTCSYGLVDQRLHGSCFSWLVDVNLNFSQRSITLRWCARSIFSYCEKCFHCFSQSGFDYWYLWTSVELSTYMKPFDYINNYDWKCIIRPSIAIYCKVPKMRINRSLYHWLSSRNFCCLMNKSYTGSWITRLAKKISLWSMILISA